MATLRDVLLFLETSHNYYVVSNNIVRLRYETLSF